MKKTMAVFVIMGMTLGVFAGISYNKSQNIIQITDFPEAAPCTMQKLLEEDRTNKWNVIDFDTKNCTYTVNANLYIGSDDGSVTYFQVGTETQPAIKIEMKGNLIVYPDAPPLKTGELYRTFADKNWPGINKLSIGNVKNKNIKPILKFAKDNGLYVGALSKVSRRPYSGELLICNAEIAALGDYRFGRDAFSFSGRVVILLDSKFSGLKNGISGVLGGIWNHSIQNITFENCGAGLINYFDNDKLKKPLKNCSFIKCDVGIQDFYGQVLMENCVFKENQHNWVFKDSLKKLTLLNCQINPPVKGNIPEKSDRIAIENF